MPTCTWIRTSPDSRSWRDRDRRLALKVILSKKEQTATQVSHGGPDVPPSRLRRQSLKARLDLGSSVGHGSCPSSQ